MEDKPVKLKSPQEKGPELGPETGLEEIDFAPLIDYFGMDRPSLEEKNDLRELLSSGNYYICYLVQGIDHDNFYTNGYTDNPTVSNSMRNMSYVHVWMRHVSD